MGHNPQWGSLIAWYFFLGGIAAGAYFVAALVDSLGDEDDRPAVNTGYWLALPLAIVLPILLIIDLGTPVRALNMFAVFNFDSPMSVGSWALLGFGAFALTSWILTVYEDRIANAAALRKKIGMVGALFGFFIASYTGVLLGTTNRPLWGGSNLLGALFLASAASTGVAAIALVLSLRGKLDGRLWKRLSGFDEIAIILEVLFLAGFLGVLGDAADLVVFGSFSGTFWTFLLAGLVVPFLLQLGMKNFSSRLPSTPTTIKATTGLLLVGGLILRYLVVFAGGA